MGYHIEKTIEISVPIERVFGYTVDGENTPEWFEGIKSARRIAGKAGQKDSVVKYEYKIADIGLEWTTEVLELDLPYKYVDLMKGGMVNLLQTGIFERVGEDRTRLRFMLDLQFPGLEKPPSRIDRGIKFTLERSLENLKSILEERFGNRITRGG